MNEPKTYWQPDDEEDSDSPPDSWDFLWWDGDPDREPDPESERPPFPGETFVASCAEPDRLDALWAILSAFADDSTQYEVINPDNPNAVLVDRLMLVDNRLDAIDWMRREYFSEGRFEKSTGTTFGFRGPSNRLLRFSVYVRSEPPGLYAPLGASARWQHSDLLEGRYPQRKHDEPYAIEVAARLAWEFAMPDAVEILVRLCTASPAIGVGGCVESGCWGLPVTNTASYHPDGFAARDLAMSFLHVYHSVPHRSTAGFSVQELREDVELAQRGSRIQVFVYNSRIREVHAGRERLQREEVLAAMDLPPDDLVAALKVCASQVHPEWQAIEGESKQLLGEIAKSNEDDVEWLHPTDEHISFLQEHSPSLVTRLDNGAVVLFAHPYRTLWPLWADALALLGIRSR
ncbi:MAG TPA: hypothetical protein PK156_39430 [Polyangium sp.]|nr:hypothetical protein [Polyangium sp.]